MKTQCLWRLDFPYKIVTEDPAFLSRRTQLAQRMLIGPQLGLAETVLAFDLDVVEVTGETEALDLGALRCGAAPFVIKQSRTPRSR
jgi:hypothetical protein